MKIPNFKAKPAKANGPKQTPELFDKIKDFEKLTTSRPEMEVDEADWLGLPGSAQRVERRA